MKNSFLDLLQEVKIQICEYGFYLCDTWLSQIWHECERILNVIHDAWKGQIFLRDWGV